MMAAILNTAILNLAIFDSSILVCPLKLTHTCQDWFPPFVQKNFTHSFWLNLILAPILNSDILDSVILLKTLTPTNSIWIKVIHSDSTWWWQPSWIQPFCTTKTSLIHSDSTWWWQPSWSLPSWIQPFCTKRNSLIHSDSTWWWQPSWILPCWIQTLPSWIQTPCHLFSDSLKNTLLPLWLCLKLIQCD